MRRALALVAAGGLAAWLIHRSRDIGAAVEQVSVGFSDGSSETLGVGSPERELLVAAATGVV